MLEFSSFAYCLEAFACVMWGNILLFFICVIKTELVKNLNGIYKKT